MTIYRYHHRNLLTEPDCHTEDIELPDPWGISAEYFYCAVSWRIEALYDRDKSGAKGCDSTDETRLYASQFSLRLQILWRDNK